VLPYSVAERLDRLAPDQREAATAPPGPVLCVAPAGSGKTTTLVARIAWLVATGADPAASPGGSCYLPAIALAEKVRVETAGGILD
jgi:hypothetical protein